MVTALSLGLLYQQQRNWPDQTSFVSRLGHAFLMRKEKAVLDLLDIEKPPVKNWKELLLFNLLQHSLSPVSDHLNAYLRSLLRRPWDENSQYQRSIVALNYALAKMKVPSVSPYLLEDGSAPIALEDLHSWITVPYLPYHAEMGVFLALIARLTQNAELQEAALGIARWQLNTLDASFYPFSGLYVQEADGVKGHLLVWNYLLFRAIGQLAGHEQFNVVAQKQLAYLAELNERGVLFLDPLLPLLEQQLGESSVANEAVFVLPQQIYDPENALVGYRSEKQNVVLTLHGGHTGLGCFQLEDTGIVSFGPQYLPLDDCRGFGIEGSDQSDKETRKSAITVDSEGFTLQGCVRFVDQPPVVGEETFQIGLFRGIWLDIEQTFRDQQLQLKANILSLDGWESVAFSFFVKAQLCWVDQTEKIKPHSFDRYEGEIKPLLLEGTLSSFQLDASQLKGSMQVISLGGQNSFWGADFLISYLLDPVESQYEWLIQPQAVSTFV